MLVVLSPRYLSRIYHFPSNHYFTPRYLAHGRPGRLVPAYLMACVLLLGFACRPVPAQEGQFPVSNNHRDLRMRELEGLMDEMSARDSMSGPAVQRPLATCRLEPYPGLANTVSVHFLELSNKVKDEYEKACTALQSKKFAESEKHLRKALQRSCLDALGWVMLGRVLEFMGRLDEASKACDEAALREPSYWPATVCLAEIDAKKQKWGDSLEESNRAISLSPDSKISAYYISALALYHLNNMGDAESRALEAERLDRTHEVPALQLLLARIEEVKGDLHAAEIQLRDCLTYANKSPEGKLAKQELARLGSGPN